MYIETLDTLEKLDKEDQEKIKYFVKLLLTKEKYKKLSKEISDRRKEITKGEVLSHNEIWEELNV